MKLLLKVIGNIVKNSFCICFMGISILDSIIRLGAKYNFALKINLASWKISGIPDRLLISKSFI